MYRLSLRLKSWGVELLLIHSDVLGNESSENRNGVLNEEPLASSESRI